MPSPETSHTGVRWLSHWFGGAIRRQLILAVVFVHAILIMVFAVDLGLRQIHAMDAARADRAHSLAQMLAASSSPWVLSSDFSGLKEIIDSASANKDLRYAMILTPSGEVLADTDSTRRGLHVADEEGRSLRVGAPVYRVLATTDASLDVAAPITANGYLVGWAWVSLSRADVHQAAMTLIWQGSFYVLLAILAGAAIASAMARNLTNGLTALAEVATRFRAGDHDVRVDVSRRDEIGLVGEGLNGMLEGIAQSEQMMMAARDQARTANQAKGVFLANMSHELRTPMNGVLGTLHLLKSEPSRRERERLIDQALASGVGLSDLLNDIIDFSDLESGHLELSVDPVDPVTELEHVLALLRAKATAKGLTLEVQASATGWVRTDPARLRKMFFHLIGNAVKFTPYGRIVIRLAASGEGEARRMRMEVEDTGIGIPVEDQASLFALFSQADGSSTRRFGGPGLGLAVTRRIAQLMGGDVGFSSVKGEGSTFWIDISTPVSAPPEQHPAPEDGWLSGLRVLVVEDNPTNRIIATKMLGQLGASVETADDGAEGVAAVERSHFDLIFMDIQMPVMDGIEATNRIRAMPPPKCLIPIVATTANVMPDQLAAYRKSGINGVVAKPISPSALVAEVAKLATQGDEPLEDADLRSA